MDLPPVVFSQWYSWPERHLIPEIGSPGLRLIAFSSAPLAMGPAQATCREVIDIGQTSKQTLKKRLTDFDMTVFRGVSGVHSAGERYRQSFPLDERWLWVATFVPTGVPVNVLPVLLRYVERKLLLDYTLAWARLPVCNAE